MKKRTTKTLVCDIILFLLCGFYCAGSKLLFHGCRSRMMNGSWMNCHWAEQAVFAFGIVLAALGLALLVLNDPGIKKGIALSMIPTAIVPAFIPNVLIEIGCGKNMRCQTVMRPAVIVLGAVIAAAAAAYLMINRKRTDKEQ